MSGIAEQHNVGHGLRAFPIFTASQGLSKSSDSAGEITGRVIDRLALGRHYLSCKIVIPFNALTQTSLGVRVTGRMLHGTSTAPATAFGSTGIVRLFSTTTTATSTGIVEAAEFDYDLRTASRFIQFIVAADLVASSSGALNYNGAYVFGGGDEKPRVAQTTGINAPTNG